MGSCRRGTAVAAVALLALTAGILAPAAGAAARPGPHPPPVARPAVVAPFTVTPSTDLVDGQVMSVVATGTTPGSTFVFAECDPVALQIYLGQLPPEDNPNDGCEEQRNTVLFSDAAGVAAGTLRASAVIATAVGTSDCRVQQCFVALFALAGGPSVQLQNLSFAAGACDVPGSCAVPTDWTPHDPARVAGRAARLSPLGARPLDTTVTRHVEAGVAGDLTVAGSVSGPYTGSLDAPAVPVGPPQTGEGLVRVALSAPGTSWAAAQPTVAVVDVSVDGGPSQQLVAFRGSTPFVYAGFTGPVTTGAHDVSVTVDDPLSVTDGSPAITIADAALEVVTPSNPSYLAYAYAPVMYGRSTSALHDTPLVDYAGSTDVGGGSVRLSYTVVWSHEDAGTGFVPFLLGGSWGRFTDIENAISFTVATDGSVSDANYLWGGQPPGYPDTQGAVSETDVAFAGSYWGHHPILRDATGNNDFSDQGTTAFRFQQAPVAAPGPGQPREAVMDANPWTYQVMGEEMGRWYSNVSLDPRSPQAGDARQYGYVQLTATGTGVASTSVDVQLSGSTTWYQGDLGSGYDLHGAGDVRTVVKLPTDWMSHSITGVRLRVFPASAVPTVHVQSLSIEGLDGGWNLSTRTLPTATVVGAAVDDPVALSTTVVSGDAQDQAPGAAVSPFVVRVTDSLDEPLEGVPVTFVVSGGPALTFTSCTCATVDAVSDAGGTASSGASTAPAQTGTVTVAASTVDPLTAPAVFDLVVARPPPTTTTTDAPTSTSTTSTTSAPTTTSAPPPSAPVAQPVAVVPELTG